MTCQSCLTCAHSYQGDDFKLYCFIWKVIAINVCDKYQYEPGTQ